jgi:hypothetical protein
MVNDPPPDGEMPPSVFVEARVQSIASWEQSKQEDDEENSLVGCGGLAHEGKG